ncbi:MAG: hypothetical protein HFG18_00990 [Oscillospiraceae bacterium]|nr:hypothetical protein [Oscillospiraceae bacterium]RKJ53727.1 hypothetical protein D7X25_11770 [bacterium 1XD42-8]RKJ63059.1 hypothetical protein D7Y09_12490 [bacterium 1XD42-1]
MQKVIGTILKDEVLHSLTLRGDLLKSRLELMDSALECSDTNAVYRHLSQFSRLTELLCRELREATREFYGNLQTVELFPILLPYPHGGEVKAVVEEGCIRLEAPTILPFCSGGSVYYLHEQVLWALEDLIREKKLPCPFFTERCALVYLHHYQEDAGLTHYLRDYDNVEHRCVTNALAALAMWGDRPDCIVSLDVLAPGERDFTEICVMTMEKFREFVLSEKIEFQMG